MLKQKLLGIALMALAATPALADPPKDPVDPYKPAPGETTLTPTTNAPTSPRPSAGAQPADDATPITCANPDEATATKVVAPEPSTSPPPPPPMAEPSLVETTEQNWFEHVGASLSIGGGVDDFAKSNMQHATGTGGSWNARLTLGNHSYVGGEIAYIGSAQSINQSNETLIGNGAQAAVRLNGTVDGPIQPFAYGGAAWRHYTLSNSGNSSNVALNDHSDVLEIPVGGGIAGYVAGLVLDVRGEYRFAVAGDSILPGNNGDSNLDRWGVSGNLGFAF